MTPGQGSEEDTAARVVTPAEVREATPKRTVGGYDRGSVDRLLADIAQGYEQVWDERDRLRAELESAAGSAGELDELRQRVRELEAELAGFTGYETRLRSMLVTADAVAGQLRETARRDAELALRKARARAERVTRRAEQKVARQRRELARIQGLEARVRAEYRDFLLEALAWSEQPSAADVGAGFETRAAAVAKRRTGAARRVGPPPLPLSLAADESAGNAVRADAS